MKKESVKGTSREALQPHLDELNRQLFGADARLQLEWVDWNDVREQDLNANSMPANMFNALVANIKKSDSLESVPLVANRQGSEVREVVSGHHRIRADRAAGHKGGLVLRYRDLTPSEIHAKQLAHNAISGTSDPELVLQLYTRIDDLGAKMESFIDPEKIGKIPPPVTFKAIDIDPQAETRTATLVFLPTQLEDFAGAIDAITAGKPDVVYLAQRETFDKFREALHRTRRECEVFALPAAITVMAQMVLKELDARKDAGAAAPAPAPADG